MGKRSNGCVTCRKRKVKCDEARPECERCKKATYKCAGYDQPWLDETRYIALARQRAAERAEQELGSREELIPSQAVTAQGFLPFETVNQPMNLSAFQDRICRSFVLYKLSSGPNVTKALTWWLSPAPRVEVQSHTLVSASRAMAASFFGRIHQQPAIVAQGESWYGEAIRNLKLDLDHREKRYTLETLGATMALNMYELVNLRSGQPGWILHAGGVGKLIQARGPGKHQRYPAKTIFLEARMLLIANAVHGCQRTFLDEQVWKDVPWEDDLLSKTAYDYLVDVLCHIPYFLEIVAHRSELYTGVIPEQLDYKILEKQLIELLDSLKDLHDAWGAQWPNAYWPVSPQPISPSEAKDTKFPQSPYETVLHFTDMWRANDFCIFSMALILGLLLFQDVAEPQVVQNTLRRMFPQSLCCSIQSLANLIGRTAEYLLLDQHGSLGFICYTFPATIAYLALDKDSPQAKYIYEVFERNAGSSGFGFGEFILNVPTPLKMWIESCKERHQCQTPCPSSDGSPDTLTSDTVTSDSSAMKTECEQCGQSCFDTPDQIMPNLPVRTSSGFAR